jgi:hypothetical protein
MNNKIPTIIGVFVLLIGVAVGVVLIQQDTVFRLGASPDITPNDVAETNVTATSFSVSWHTDKQTVGYVNWGDSKGLGKIAREETIEPAHTHQVDISNLAPGGSYYFKIISEGKEFDNANEPWAVETPGNILEPRNAGVISGIIKTKEGQPAGDVIVYISGQTLAPLSVATTPDGRWFYALSKALNPSLSGYAILNADTVVGVHAEGGINGAASATAKIGFINPAPEMKLGNKYDFQTSGGVNGGVVPGQNKNAGGQDGTSVTLDSLDEGETIFTTNPEFFGEGPAGGEITVTVESEHEITTTVPVLLDGTWKWSPAISLSEGSHKITLSWFDSAGILQSITKNFVVFASPDDPAFEATSSGGATFTPVPTASPTLTPTKSPTPSASPTKSPVPTKSPSPTLKPTASPTVIPTISPTPISDLPPAGVSMPTIVGVVSGIMLLVGSLLIVI